MTSFPSTQPAATRVAITVGEGVAQKIVADGGTYQGFPQGNALHVHCLNLWQTPDQGFDSTVTWDFGDKQDNIITDPISGKPVSLNTGQQGPVAAYVYPTAGTYTITMRVFKAPTDGSTPTVDSVQESKVSVVIPPPGRKVYYVSSKGKDTNKGLTPDAPFLTSHQNLIADNVELAFECGGTYGLSTALAYQHKNVFVSSYGTGALPILTMTAGGSICGTWPSTTNHVGMYNVRLKGHPHAAVSGDGIKYDFGDANGGFLRGDGFTAINVEIDTLDDGLKGSVDLHGGYFQGIVQISPWGVRGRTLWEEGSDVVVLGCKGLNSATESTNRVADTGVIRGSHCYNYWSQLFVNPLAPTPVRTGAKAAFTHRTLWSQYVYRNKIVDGNMSYDPHTGDAYDRYVDCRSNDLSGNTQLEIKANTWDSAFRWNHIVTKYIGISVRPDNEGESSALTMHNVRVQYNDITAGSNDVDMYVHDASRLVGYVESNNIWTKK